MGRARQLSLLKDPRGKTKLWWIVKRTTYGGSLNYRKVARPFDRKKLVHAVFKAKLGRSVWFSGFALSHQSLIRQAALRYQIQIKDFAVHNDHIHLLYSAKSRELNGKFLRLVSSELGRWYARLFRKLGIKSRPLWTHRPFTRLVSWGRKSLIAIQKYIHKNRQEVMGFIPYLPRQHRLARFLEAWCRPILNSA